MHAIQNVNVTYDAYHGNGVRIPVSFPLPPEHPLAVELVKYHLEQLAKEREQRIAAGDEANVGWF